MGFTDPIELIRNRARMRYRFHRARRPVVEEANRRAGIENGSESGSILAQYRKGAHFARRGDVERAVAGLGGWRKGGH